MVWLDCDKPATTTAKRRRRRRRRPQQSQATRTDEEKKEEEELKDEIKCKMSKQKQEKERERKSWLREDTWDANVRAKWQANHASKSSAFKSLRHNFRFGFRVEQKCQQIETRLDRTIQFTKL